MAEDNDIIGVAGEYVLGTLDTSERAWVAQERVGNQRLNAEIKFWEEKFFPFTPFSKPVQPSPEVWRKVEAAISNVVIDARHNFQRRLQQWRVMALAASVVAVVSVVFNVYVLHYPGAHPTAVAFLQKDAGAPVFMVSMNEHDHSLTVDVKNGQMPQDKSYELWLILPDKPSPRSMGILKLSRTVLQPDLSSIAEQHLHDATLAISVEPSGGSPTGQPTGPVISTGKFQQANSG